MATGGAAKLNNILAFDCAFQKCRAYDEWTLQAPAFTIAEYDKVKEAIRHSMAGDPPSPPQHHHRLRQSQPSKPSISINGSTKFH